jgi:hypothetical protein
MPPLAHRRGCQSGTLPRSVVAGTAVALEPGVHNPYGSLIRIPR